MRVAALYDIHGNAAALTAVLREVLASQVDVVVVGGDVWPGPQAREALALLDGLPVPVRYVRGNGERELLAVRDGRHVALPPAVIEVLRWNAAQLSDELVARLRAWPTRQELGLGAQRRALFVHATPEDDTTIVTERTPDERFAQRFGGVDADLVVCGHTHIQFERHLGPRIVVNAGSVGMPFEGVGARWLLVGDGLELRRTDYDLEAAAASILATDYPDRAAFVARYVIAAPQKEEMLARYETAGR